MEELMMNLTDEVKWVEFLEMHCSDDLRITKTPDYDLILMEQRATAKLMVKLLQTAAVTGDSAASSRNRSAALIKDIARSKHLDALYPTIDDTGNNLMYFRYSAAKLMVQSEDGSPLQVAGKELTKKLARLSIQHSDPWNGFSALLVLAFNDVNTRKLELFLDVLCEVDDDYYGWVVDGVDDLRPRFAAFLEPTVREYSHRFHTLLLQKLRNEEAEDVNYRAFQMLPLFHHIFTHQPHRNVLMEAAIMSPLFLRPNLNQKMLGAAINLKACIEGGGKFRLSPAMIGRLNRLILLIYNKEPSLMGREKRVAQQFVIAISSRLGWFVPDNRRKRKRTN